MNELYLNVCPFAEIITVVSMPQRRALYIDFEDRTERLRVGSVHEAQVRTLAPSLRGAFLSLRDGTSVFAPTKYLGGARVGDRLRVVVRKPERQSKYATVALASPEDAERDTPQTRFERLGSRLQSIVSAYRPERIHLEDRSFLPLLTEEQRNKAHILIEPGLLDISIYAGRVVRDDVEIVIDETEAFTIMDINASSSRESAFAVNRSASKRVLEEILLRDIRGNILIDFIDMDSTLQTVFLEELRCSGYGSRNEIKLHGFTALGILELSRAKRARSLNEKLRTNQLWHAVRCYYELSQAVRSMTWESDPIVVKLDEALYQLFQEFHIEQEFGGAVKTVLKPTSAAFSILFHK